MICMQSNAASLVVRSGSVHRGTILPSNSPWAPSSRDDCIIFMDERMGNGEEVRKGGGRGEGKEGGGLRKRGRVGGREEGTKGRRKKGGRTLQKEEHASKLHQS